MSLRGRYVIDRMKRWVSGTLKLPVPPYGDPAFWEHVYGKMGEIQEDDDPNFRVFEWGNVHFGDVAAYNYRPLRLEGLDMSTMSSRVMNPVETEGTTSTTLGETLGVHPVVLLPEEEEADEDAIQEAVLKQLQELPEEPVAMLGCGTSIFGQEMLECRPSAWRGPIIQIDIAERALDILKFRCPPAYLEQNRMQFVQDDCTELKSIQQREKVKAVIDKGMMDSLFCASEYEQMIDTLLHVERILQPGGIFCFFSFSRPEFIFPNIVLSDGGTLRVDYRRQKDTNRRLLWTEAWEDMQVRQLDQILLYRFQKKSKNGPSRGTNSESESTQVREAVTLESLKKKRRRR